MLRRRKPERSRPNGVLEKRESSRLSQLVISNPVNQSAHWSQDSYLLNDLVGTFPLPQVVRCSSRLVPGEDQHLPVNVHVPMLLCAGRSARKLLAKHVGTDSRSQKLTETDDSIVIPSDYDGNFVRLQARTTKDKSVARTLHDIAPSHIPAFVNFSPIISFSNNNHQQKTNGVMVSNDSIYSEPAHSNGSSLGTKLNSKHIHADGHMQHRKVHPPGGVFMVQGVTTGKTKTKRKTREVTLIKCSDDTGNEILIPSDQHGEVIEVETPPTGTARLSVQPKDLMANNRYPGLVRYVYGDHAPRLTPCSLMFTLIDTFEEDSVIGCLLYPNHALMIEIPMTSSLGFQVAQNRDDVMSMPLPRHALGVVQNRRETFMRDLKLKCKFLHRVNQGLMQNWSMSGRADDDMPSATVRTRQYANEAFFYL